MEKRIVDENKLAVHGTIGEIAEAVIQRLENKKKTETVTTAELMEILGVSSKGTITNYHKLGMPNKGRNKWIPADCLEFVNNKLPKILYSSNRK